MVGGNKNLKNPNSFLNFDLKNTQATPDTSAFYKTKFCIFIYIKHGETLNLLKLTIFDGIKR